MTDQPSNSTASERGKWEVRAVWVQSLAAVLTLVLGIPGLWLALEAFQDQQTINMSQLELNRLAQIRFEQRYAARVAFWTVDQQADDDAPTLRLQNRAPVPLDNIFIEGRRTHTSSEDPYQVGVGLAQLPPCSLISISVPKAAVLSIIDLVTKAIAAPNSHATANQRAITKVDVSDPLWFKVYRMTFGEPTGYWSLSDGKINRTDRAKVLLFENDAPRFGFSFTNADNDVKGGTSPTPLQYTLKDLEDCGEAG